MAERTELFAATIHAMRQALGFPADERTQGGLDVAELFEFANSQQVLALIYPELQRTLDMGRVIPSCRTAYQRSVMAASVRDHQYRELASALERRHVVPVVIKGMALAEWYPRRSARWMSDIDLLFTPDKLTAALDELHLLGYSVTKPEAVSLSSHYVLRRYPHEDRLELHTTLNKPPRGDLIDMASVFERVVDGAVCGVPARLLDPTDHLLYLCLHAASHHRLFFTLKLMSDIACLFHHAGTAINTEQLMADAERAGIRKAVLALVRLSDELLNVGVTGPLATALRDVPDSDVQMLRDSLTMRVTRDADTTVTANAWLDQPNLRSRLHRAVSSVFLPMQLMCELHQVAPTPVGYSRGVCIRIGRKCVRAWRILVRVIRRDRQFRREMEYSALNRTLYRRLIDDPKEAPHAHNL